MKNLRAKKRQKGSNLVEVLVALFVLAVGLLGAMAMHVNSQQSNQRGMFVTEASMLASEMAERILAYNDLDDALDDDDYDGIDTSAPPGDPGCIVAGCDKAEQVQYDVFTWANELSTRLPAGLGTVDWNNANRVYTVTVMWDNDRTGAAGTACSGNTDVDLTCMRIEVAM